MQKLDKAIDILLTQNKSCVVLNDNECYSSTESGIKPLMVFLRQDKDFFKGAVVADKIIGKAAALLLILGKAEACYGEIMSKSAIEVFEKNGIEYRYGKVVDYIQNRIKTGMCPMEETVINISSPIESFKALEEKIAALMANK